MFSPPRAIPSLPRLRTFLAAMSSTPSPSPAVPAVMQRLEKGELPWGSVFSDKMLTMSWTKSAGWEAPRIVPYGPLALPPSAAVFHYAMEVFEGLKAYRTVGAGDGPVRLFRPQLNIKRLNHSARRLALPTVDEHKFLNTLAAFVDEQQHWVPSIPGSSLYLRPTLIATDARIGVRRSDSALLYVIASPVASFFANRSALGAKYQTGLSLLADPKYVRAWKGGVGNCKTGGNYASSIKPTEEAKEKGHDQILWLSDEKRQLVTEVGMMNVFFVFRDAATGQKKLVTPRLDGTILDGVTRRSILELAPGMNIEAEERDISIMEVCEGVRNGNISEIFGAGTAAVVSPVHKVETPGGTVAVKRKEASGDLSVILRERLVDIHQSGGEHQWMVPVTGDKRGSSYFDKEEGQDEGVRTSPIAATG